jgi:hypothetical protein
MANANIILQVAVTGLEGLIQGHNNLVSDIIRKAAEKFDSHLESYLKESLKQFGYEFESQSDFYEFCKARLHRIGFGHKSNYYELYLDYKDAENKGPLVGCYSHDISLDMQGNKMTITFGGNKNL